MGETVSYLRARCCLSWNGRKKFHGGMIWMKYLIDHLLRSGARARTSAA